MDIESKRDRVKQWITNQRSLYKWVLERSQKDKLTKNSKREKYVESHDLSRPEKTSYREYIFSGHINTGTFNLYRQSWRNNLTLINLCKFDSASEKLFVLFHPGAFLSKPAKASSVHFQYYVFAQHNFSTGAIK